MKLKGKLKEEFEGWVCANDTALHYGGGCPHITDIFSELPISMQFALLCDFLESKKYYVGISFFTTVAPLGVYYEVDINEEEWIKTDTKTEAIEKAIEYLNENY